MVIAKGLFLCGINKPNMSKKHKRKAQTKSINKKHKSTTYFLCYFCAMKKAQTKAQRQNTTNKYTHINTKQKQTTWQRGSDTTVSCSRPVQFS